MRKRIVASAVIAAMIGMGAGVATHASEPVREDTAQWDCRTMGNHVCGPESEYRPGCYVDGSLAEPWDRYDHYARTIQPCGMGE